MARHSHKKLDTSKSLKCQLCGSQDIFCLYELEEYNILKCRNCHLVFTEPLSINLSELYSVEYFEEFQSNFFSRCHDDYANYKQDPRLTSFKEGLDFLMSHKEVGKILDVGCATGVFLDMAKNKGWEPYGVDISEYAASYARDKFGIKVETRELQDVNFPSAYFDIITMWDTIEHVPNPGQILQECLRILKGDGLLFIVTVDEDSFIPRVADILYRITGKKLKKPIKLVHPIHHITHFSKLTLKQMLRNTGFEIVYLGKGEIPLQNLRWNWGTKILIGIMYFFARLLNMQYEVKLLVKKA